MFNIYPFPKFVPSSYKGLQVQNFGGLDWGGFPQPGTPDFCRTKVIPDIFNHLNFDYSAFRDLKVDSGRSKQVCTELDSAVSSF